MHQDEHNIVRGVAANDCVSADATDGRLLGYQLMAWPLLTESFRIAKVYRALSVMTMRPVTLNWLCMKTGWSPSVALQFIKEMDAIGCIKTVDPLRIEGLP